jgi:hypothetical protein
MCASNLMKREKENSGKYNLSILNYGALKRRMPVSTGSKIIGICLA